MDDAIIEDARMPDSLPRRSGEETAHNDNERPITVKISVLEDFTNRSLLFLSTASNEALGAVFVGLGACTYLILGRVGLVLMGTIGGVILHATWESSGQPDSKDANVTATGPRKGREVGLDVAKRLLEWRQRTAANSTDDGVDGDPNQDINYMISAHKELNYDGFRPATNAALSSLTDAIIRDHVKWWYTSILPTDTTFPFACKQTLTGFILAISNHLSRKRFVDTFLDFLTNSSSIVIVFLSELSKALMSADSLSLSASEAVDKYLEENPNSNLANVLNQDQQSSKFKIVAEDILQTFLDSKVYNCQPAKAFLREVLAGVILETTVKGSSTPDFFNSWIVHLLEEGEPELLNAIDAGVGNATTKEIKNSASQVEVNQMSAQHITNGDSSSKSAQAKLEHKRRVSRAEGAMEEAMLEAKRLSELIAAEDAKKALATQDEASSSNTIQADTIPIPSQSDLIRNTSNDHGHIVSDNTNHITSAGTESMPHFTTFDQILPSQRPTALQSNDSSINPAIPAPFTLYNATVIMFEDSQAGENSSIRSRPMADYHLQIEPASSHHHGWMITRKYADFETLHEVLKRISVVSGVAEFSDKHTAIPTWKGSSKVKLREGLEHYLRDALSFNRLAESEGMKRFLEKEKGRDQSPSATKSAIGFPSPAAFETMGKGMLDVLTSAPKGVAGGGKAVFGGVSSVFGGPKKQRPATQLSEAGRKSSFPILGRSQSGSIESNATDPIRGRSSQESFRSISTTSLEAVKAPPLPSRPGEQQSDHRNGEDAPTARNQRPMLDKIAIRDNDSVLQNNAAFQGDTALRVEPEMHLPPPPSAIPDDYKTFSESPRTSIHESFGDTLSFTETAPTSTQSSLRNVNASEIFNDTHLHESPQLPDVSTAKPTTKLSKPKPLTEAETRVAVELFFAVVNELYTLSSAWNIRRTLLNAAKTFLLRPGNPSLEAIRLLLQETVINANTSDAGLASHLLKLRANTMPTEDERNSWAPPMSDEEKEKLRIKARRLLVTKGMPAALTSVMGAAASGEALGRVFDCLQIESVGRGFMFALLLQGVRAITQ